MVVYISSNHAGSSSSPFTDEFIQGLLKANEESENKRALAMLAYKEVFYCYSCNKELDLTQKSEEELKVMRCGVGAPCGDCAQRVRNLDFDW